MSIQNKVQQIITSMALIGALLGACVGCQKTAEKTDMRVPQTRRVMLPSGAGVVLTGKQVVLIPEGHENRTQYEKRIKDMNDISSQVGYQFVTILTPENKAAYDGFMMDFYARQGKIYNMISNPISSWASMQMGIGMEKMVAQYTPDDIRKAMQESKITDEMIQRKVQEKMREGLGK